MPNGISGLRQSALFPALQGLAQRRQQQAEFNRQAQLRREEANRQLINQMLTQGVQRGSVPLARQLQTRLGIDVPTPEDITPIVPELTEQQRANIATIPRFETRASIAPVGGPLEQLAMLFGQERTAQQLAAQQAAQAEAQQAQTQEARRLRELQLRERQERRLRTKEPTKKEKQQESQLKRLNTSAQRLSNQISAVQAQQTRRARELTKTDELGQKQFTPDAKYKRDQRRLDQLLQRLNTQNRKIAELGGTEFSPDIPGEEEFTFRERFGTFPPGTIAPAEIEPFTGPQILPEQLQRQQLTQRAQGETVPTLNRVIQLGANPQNLRAYLQNFTPQEVRNFLDGLTKEQRRQIQAVR